MERGTCSIVTKAKDVKRVVSGGDPHLNAETQRRRGAEKDTKKLCVSAPLRLCVRFFGAQGGKRAGAQGRREDVAHTSVRISGESFASLHLCVFALGSGEKGEGGKGLACGYVCWNCGQVSVGRKKGVHVIAEIAEQREEY